jgi:hypothetical protein
MQKKPSAGATRAPSRKRAEPPEAPVSVSTETARPNPGVVHEDIARLAHSFWEARGRQGGSPEADWLRAEQELKSRQETLPRKRVLKRRAAS